MPLAGGHAGGAHTLPCSLVRALRVHRTMSAVGSSHPRLSSSRALIRSMSLVTPLPLDVEH